MDLDQFCFKFFS